MKNTIMRLVTPGLCLLTISAGLQAGIPDPNAFAYPAYFGHSFGKRAVLAQNPRRPVLPAVPRFQAPGHSYGTARARHSGYAPFRFRPWAAQPTPQAVSRIPVVPRGPLPFNGSLRPVFAPGMHRSMAEHRRFPNQAQQPLVKSARAPTVYRFRPMQQPAYRGSYPLAYRYGAAYRWRPLSANGRRLPSGLDRGFVSRYDALAWRRSLQPRRYVVQTGATAPAYWPVYSYRMRPTYPGVNRWPGANRMAMPYPVRLPVASPSGPYLIHQRQSPYPFVAARALPRPWSPQLQWMHRMRTFYRNHAPVRFYPPDYLFAGNQYRMRQLPTTGTISKPGRYNPMRRYVFRPAPRLESNPGFPGLAYRAREVMPDGGIGRSKQRSSSQVGTGQHRIMVEFGGLKGELESEALAQLDSSGAPDHRPVFLSYGSLRNTELSAGGLADDEPLGRINVSAGWSRN